MADQSKFIAAFGSLFPVLSDTMLVKCWHEAKRLPEDHYAALYSGLLQGAIVAMDARKAQCAAITGAIGVQIR